MASFRLFLAITLSFLISLPAQAQDYELKKMFNSFGFYAHFNLNQHNVDFKELPNVPNCCPEWKNSNGNGFTFGMSYFIPMTKMWTLNFRAEFSSADAVLSALEYESIIIDNQPIFAEIEHKIDTDVKIAGLSPLIAYKPLEDMYLFAGFSANYILNKTFSQTEMLLKPERGTFENDSIVRNRVSGDIEDSGDLLFFITLGISYDLPLNSRHTFFASPEIFYLHGVNSMLKNDSWNISQFRIGISLKYRRDSRYTTPIGPKQI